MSNGWTKVKVLKCQTSVLGGPSTESTELAEWRADTIQSSVEILQTLEIVFLAIEIGTADIESKG